MIGMLISFLLAFATHGRFVAVQEPGLDTRPLSHLVSSEADLAVAWENLPLVSRQVGRIEDVFSMDVVHKLLRDGFPAMSARLYNGGEKVDVGTLVRGENAVLKLEHILDYMSSESSTLILDNLSDILPELKSLGSEISALTGQLVYFMAFWSTARCRAVPAHYDFSSVIIRQIRGSKTFTIGDPESIWPRDAWNDRPVTFVNERHVTLHQGDSLYLPRGYVHQTATADEESLHLAVCLIPMTWETLVHKVLLEVACMDSRLREALPFGFTNKGDDWFREEWMDRLDIAFSHLRKVAGATLMDQAFDPDMKYQPSC